MLSVQWTYIPFNIKYFAIFYSWALTNDRGRFSSDYIVLSLSGFSSTLKWLCLLHSILCWHYSNIQNYFNCSKLCIVSFYLSVWLFCSRVLWHFDLLRLIQPFVTGSLEARVLASGGCRSVSIHILDYSVAHYVDSLAFDSRPKKRHKTIKRSNSEAI